MIYRLQVLHNHCNSPYLENTLPLRVFGCTTYVHLHQTTKLDPKAVRCLFLGYSAAQKGYKCYDPTTKRIYITCDVTFHENIPFYSESSIQGENLSEFQPEQSPTSDTHESLESFPLLFFKEENKKEIVSEI